MADLTNAEKRKFERIFGMGGGYVLDFSNRTFGEFFEDAVGLNIFDQKYNWSSGSKANRMRAFWSEEANHIVACLLREMISYGNEREIFNNDPPTLIEACQRTIARLEQVTAFAESEALLALGDDRDFERIAQEVRDSINANKLEAGLDRLHTFVVKFVRTLCEKHGLTVDREKALHSIFGEYVKRLRSERHLESDMSERILKASISILEAFNDVRNNRSLAHDNKLLTYEESLLIFNHVAASIRFLRSLEHRIEQRTRNEAPAPQAFDDDIPF
jgi:Abortive infection C-terminus